MRLRDADNTSGMPRSFRLKETRNRGASTKKHLHHGCSWLIHVFMYLLITCSPANDDHDEHDGDTNGGLYRMYNRSHSAPQGERVRISNIIIVACIYIAVFTQLTPYPLATCY